MMLLEHGAKHNIFSAAYTGDLDEVKRQLLSVSINLVDPWRNRTALEWAVSRLQDEVAEYLIESGAEVTPEVMIRLGMRDELRRCLKSDPDLTKTTDPLGWAAEAGQLDIFEALIAAGTDLNTPSRLGLYYDISKLQPDESPAFVKVLVESNYTEAQVRQPYGVYWLTLRGHFRALEILFKHDRSGIDRHSWRGLTPLQEILLDPTSIHDTGRFAQSPVAVRFLLDHGADVNQLSKSSPHFKYDHDTALDIVLAERAPEPIIELLGQYGGRRASEL